MCYLVVSQLKESILRDGFGSREWDLRAILSCIYFYETAEKKNVKFVTKQRYPSSILFW